MSTAPPSLAGPAILFCPADRPDRYRKALERADCVILDLEDAVAGGRKADARRDLQAWTADPANRPDLAADPLRIVVRINAIGSGHYADDVRALASSGIRAVMLPKVEAAADLDRLAADLPGVAVVALCETALGIVRSLEIAQHPAVAAVMWGGEDLTTSLGGSSSRTVGGTLRHVFQTARSTVLLNAAAGGKPGIDTVYTDIRDMAGLAAETEDGAASGFAFKACIHPSQADVVRSAFLPGPEELRRARAVLDLVHSGRGVVQFEGEMVDEPVIRQAERIIERGRAAGGPTRVP